MNRKRQWRSVVVEGRRGSCTTVTVWVIDKIFFELTRGSKWSTRKRTYGRMKPVASMWVNSVTGDRKVCGVWWWKGIRILTSPTSPWDMVKRKMNVLRARWRNKIRWVVDEVAEVALKNIRNVGKSFPSSDTRPQPRPHVHLGRCTLISGVDH